MKDRYWFSISLLLAATVLAIGEAPLPLLWILGPAVLLGFIVVGIMFRQFARVTPTSGAGSVLTLLSCSILTFYIAMLLRGSDVAVFTTPALALALGGGCFLWARKKGFFITHGYD